MSYSPDPGRRAELALVYSRASTGTLTSELDAALARVAELEEKVAEHQASFELYKKATRALDELFPLKDGTLRDLAEVCSLAARQIRDACPVSVSYDRNADVLYAKRSTRSFLVTSTTHSDDDVVLNLDKYGAVQGLQLVDVTALDWKNHPDRVYVPQDILAAVDAWISEYNKVV